MSIRDIIEAATHGPWESDDNGNVFDPSVSPMHDDPRMAMSSVVDARFIATFDPEHVALMEAVVEALARAGANYWRIGDECRAWHSDVDAVADVREALDALTAYRKERNL